MGYESKIFVVNTVHGFSNEYIYAETIATIRMGCMTPDFHKLFRTEIDYEIYAEDDNHATSTDRYGDRIKSAKIKDVIKWLESEVIKDDYRRLRPLLGLLKGFNEEQWDELEVLHYGY